LFIDFINWKSPDLSEQDLRHHSLVRSIVEPVMLTALGLHLRNFKRFIERGTR